MKTIFSILILMGCVLTANCQIKTGYSDGTYRDGEYFEDTLNGRVKSVIEYQYGSDSAYRQKSGNTTIRLFDHYGKIVQTIDSLLSENNFFFYDSLGRLACIKHYRSSMLFQTTFYRYDNAQNLIQIEEWHNDSICFLKTIFTYDEKNRKAKSKTYGSYNLVLRDYRDNWKLTKRELRHIHQKETWKYDSRNNISEDQLSGKDVSYLSSRKVYLYNDINRVSEFKEYNKDGSFWIKTAIKYNSNGYINESVTRFESDFVRNKSIYQYAEDYIDRKDTIFSNNGVNFDTYQFHYQDFDRYHNWLKVVALNNGGFWLINERKIEYY